MVRGVSVDSESVKQAYDEVRADDNETVFALFTYEEDNSVIRTTVTGPDYSQVLEVLGAEDGAAMRAYAFVRLTTGDEMSKRAKFALITWCGNAVNPMKKAKMSLEKTEVKKVVEVFSVEFQTSDLEDISLERVLGSVKQCGGANYGVGK